jgi:hypothetical protein
MHRYRALYEVAAKRGHEAPMRVCLQLQLPANRRGGTLGLVDAEEVSETYGVQAACCRGLWGNS